MIFSVASLAVEWLTTTHAECIVEYRTEATRKAVEEEEVFGVFGPCCSMTNLASLPRPSASSSRGPW